MHTCDRLGEIEAPTLVIHGTVDQMLPVSNAHAISARHPRRAARDPRRRGPRVLVGASGGVGAVRPRAGFRRFSTAPRPGAGGSARAGCRPPAGRARRRRRAGGRPCGRRRPGSRRSAGRAPARCHPRRGRGTPPEAGGLLALQADAGREALRRRKLPGTLSTSFSASSLSPRAMRIAPARVARPAGSARARARGAATPRRPPRRARRPRWARGRRRSARPAAGGCAPTNSSRPGRP